MQYRTLGKTGYNVSAIVYGGIVSTNDGQIASDRYVSWAIDQGVNYFDVAPKYGDAQEKLGNSLIPYRKDIYLACKTNRRTREEAEKDLKGSMELLHTDYFDVYQMHELSTMQELETAFGPGGVMEMIRDMKEKGITRKVGFTCHNEEVALKALELYDFDTVLFPFNWHMNMEHGMGNRIIKAAKERNMGVLCMKSMIERAWNPETDQEALKKYPKSWCKPIDTDTDQELLIAALKYAWSLGIDVLIPPGNYDHFSFGVRHLNEILTPLTSAEKGLLAARLENVRNQPFFHVNGSIVENR